MCLKFSKILEKFFFEFGLSAGIWIFPEFQPDFIKTTVPPFYDLKNWSYIRWSTGDGDRDTRSSGWGSGDIFNELFSPQNLPEPADRLG